MERYDAFVDDCRFAKVIPTSDGPVLLIGGVALRVFGPPIEEGFWSIEGLAQALRNPSPLVSEAASAMYQAAAQNGGTTP